MTRKLGRCVLAMMLAGSTVLLAAEPAARPDPATLTYTAPDTRSEVRVNATTRSGADRASIILLTPDHVARTVQATPSVFWYQSRADEVKGVLTVTRPGEPEPVLEVEIAGNVVGIQRLDFAKYEAKLEPDVEYRVSVALKYNDDNPADNPFSQGVIQRIEPPRQLVTQLLNKADKIDRAFVFASEGIWFDALTAISDQIEATQDPTLHRYRAALLEAGQLPDAAAFELKRASRE